MRGERSRYKDCRSDGLVLEPLPNNFTVLNPSPPMSFQVTVPLALRDLKVLPLFVKMIGTLPSEHGRRVHHFVLDERPRFLPEGAQ